MFVLLIARDAMIDHENDDRVKQFWLVIEALWAAPWALIV